MLNPNHNHNLNPNPSPSPNPNRSTPHAATAASLFLTLAELLSVATSRLDLYAEELLALLVQALRESGSSHKREAALTALERLVACSG